MKPYYYLQSDNDRLGPFSLEDLKDKLLQPGTPVWKEGLVDWTVAGKLEELSSYLIKTPPVYKKPTTTKPGFFTGISIRKILIVILLAILAVGIIDNITRTKPRLFNPSLYIAPPPDYEHLNPTNFMEATGTYKPIIFTNKWKIEGLILNKATHTNYKDIKIRVNFLSATKTVIDSKDFIIYEYVPQGTTQLFNLEVERPQAAAFCGWEVIGGTWY
jgi:hypothetical protein